MQAGFKKEKSQQLHAVFIYTVRVPNNKQSLDSALSYSTASVNSASKVREATADFHQCRE